MKMLLMFAAVLSIGWVPVSAADDTLTYEGVITAGTLPDGYKLTRQDVKQGEEKLGTKLIIAKEGSPSRVVVSIEVRELSDAKHRIAAIKGYVNGTAQSLSQAGLKPLSKDIPDVAQADLSKPFVANLIFENKIRNNVYVRIRVFFTQVGYNVVVFAIDRDDLKSLSRWAESVKEK